MAEQDLKCGDVVRLTSGGIKMTLGEIKDGYAECVWFDDGKCLHQAVLSLDSLKKVN